MTDSDRPEPQEPYDPEDEKVGGPEPAPSEPFPIVVENVGMLVPDGEEIATGWEPFAATDNDFEEPEYYAAELNGQRVQGVRGEHRFDVSFMQAINDVTPGLTVTFTMDFQVEPGDEHKDRERPAGIVVGVGLDPTGGRDPRSDTVRWALRDTKYNELVTASVTADAEAAGVVRDRVVRLGSNAKSDEIAGAVRVVEFKCLPHVKRLHTGRGGPEQSETVVIATDLLDVEADVIALIFQHRWTIEIFFRFFNP